ncbi:MAG: hypothetical protein M3235_23095 [Actinomycetota bacterium]|nr:hypothetical protein [Actinomycetota bacterium]
MSITKLRETDGAAAPPRLRRRRSSRLLLLAVVLAVLGALAGAYAYSAASGRVGVVALGRSLPVGATVALTDIREVQLPDDTGLATVAWEDIGGVVGRVTTTDLYAGQILTPDSVTDTQVPAPGEAVVGVSVENGRAPISELSPGDQVLVIIGAGRPGLRASVVSVGAPDVSGRRGVDVLVRQADAEELALASVDDRVAIVLVGRG